MPNYIQSPMRSQFDKALRGHMEYRRRSGGVFNPASMFTPTTPGWVYDLSDFSTLFQDSAGTTPVTAVGQPVGLVLDKSQGLELGPEMIPDVAAAMAPRNANSTLNSETSTSIQVTSAATGTYGVAAAGVAATVGRLYAINMTMTSSVTRSFTVIFGGAARNITCMAGVPFAYTGFNGPTAAATFFDIYAPAAAAGEVLTVSSVSVKLLPGNHASQPTTTKRAVLSARVNRLLATDVLSTQSVAVTAVPYVLSFTGTGTITLSGASTAGPLVGTGASNRVDMTFTPTAGSLTLTVSGSVTLAQLEYAV